jgi:hypothetical protein
MDANPKENMKVRGPSCGTQTYDCTPPCVNRKRIKILLCGI